MFDNGICGSLGCECGQEEKVLKKVGAKCHPEMVTRIIPVFVGCLGVMSDYLTGYLETLGVPDVVGGPLLSLKSERS